MVVVLLAVGSGGFRAEARRRRPYRGDDHLLVPARDVPGHGDESPHRRVQRAESLGHHGQGRVRRRLQRHLQQDGRGDRGEPAARPGRGLPEPGRGLPGQRRADRPRTLRQGSEVGTGQGLRRLRSRLHHPGRERAVRRPAARLPAQPVDRGPVLQHHVAEEARHRRSARHVGRVRGALPEGHGPGEGHLRVFARPVRRLAPVRVRHLHGRGHRQARRLGLPVQHHADALRDGADEAPLRQGLGEEERQAVRLPERVRQRPGAVLDQLHLRHHLLQGRASTRARRRSTGAWARCPRWSRPRSRRSTCTARA